MNNNYHIYHKYFIQGFAPNPTSFFALMQRTKQEKSSQNECQPSLLQGRNFKQGRKQASLQKFHALQHYSHCQLIFKVFMNCFASSHPSQLHVLAWPPHGALSIGNHNACGAKKQIPYSDGLPFKRRRQPECVQTVSLLWLLSVTTESDKKETNITFK